MHSNSLKKQAMLQNKFHLIYTYQLYTYPQAKEKYLERSILSFTLTPYHQHSKWYHLNEFDSYGRH